MTGVDDDRLAAEYVLGLLEGEEARAAETRMSEPAFARSVEAWRQRFAELDATAPPTAVGDGLWSRIETGAFAAPPRAVAAQVPAWRRLWNDLSFWRGAGLVAAAACLVLAVGLGFALQAAARKPLLIAVLMTETNEAAAVVNIGADRRADLLPLQPVAVPPGRVLEVWTLWDRTRGPVSLGTLQAARNSALRLDQLPPVVPNQLFEITLEPAGGSPTGRPTGAILMKGLASEAL